MNKNLRIIKSLFIVIFILFFSCEKDLYEDTLQKENNKNIKYKTIKLSEIKKYSPKTARALIKIQNSSDNIKIDSRQIYGKEIDSTNIIYLVNDNGFESFTFKVLQAEGLSHFENIIINNYPNGNIDAFITKFNLNKPLELVKLDKNLGNSILNIETSKLNNTNSNFTNRDCLTVGYYDTVDACEGELVTPGENPECFNSDGTRKQREIFIVLAEDCSNSSGGSFGGVVVGPPSGNGGSGGEYSAIFIPNPYEGEEDLNNPSYVLANQITAFITTIKNNYSQLNNTSQLNNIFSNTNWFLYALIDFGNDNDDFTDSDKDAIEFTLNNIVSVYDIINQNSSNLTDNEVQELKYKTLMFLLNNPNTNVNNFNELMEFIASNNIEIDYIQNNNNSNLINFNSISELDIYNQTMKTESQDNSNGSQGFDNQNRHYSTKTISISCCNNLAIEVVTNPLPNFSIVQDQSTTFLSNSVIGNTWVQTSMNITNINYSSTHAQVTLSGYINSGITWEGFEIGLKYRKKIVFLINKNTGQIGSSSVYNQN